MKSLNEMEELKRFQGSTFATISRRRLIEDRDTILELTGKIQELHKDINCMNDSRDFQDAESKCSGQSHVTSQPVFGDAHFSFPRKNLRVLCGCFRSQETGAVRRMGGGAAHDHHGFLARVEVELLASTYCVAGRNE